MTVYYIHPDDTAPLAVNLRRSLVAGMRATGESVWSIAGCLKVSVATVNRDLRALRRQELAALGLPAVAADARAKFQHLYCRALALADRADNTAAAVGALRLAAHLVQLELRLAGALAGARAATPLATCQLDDDTVGGTPTRPPAALPTTGTLPQQISNGSAAKNPGHGSG